jgi:hypothetical protein
LMYSSILTPMNQDGSVTIKWNDGKVEQLSSSK